MQKNTLPFRFLEETIGIPIEIISNDFEELAGNTHQKKKNLIYGHLAFCSRFP